MAHAVSEHRLPLAAVGRAISSTPALAKSTLPRIGQSRRPTPTTTSPPTAPAGRSGPPSPRRGPASPGPGLRANGYATATTVSLRWNEHAIDHTP